MSMANNIMNHTNLEREKMTGGPQEVRSDKSLNLLTFDVSFLTFDIWHLTFDIQPMDQWTNGQANKRSSHKWWKLASQDRHCWCRLVGVKNKGSFDVFIGRCNEQCIMQDPWNIKSFFCVWQQQQNFNRYTFSLGPLITLKTYQSNMPMNQWLILVRFTKCTSHQVYQLNLKFKVHHVC